MAKKTGRPWQDRQEIWYRWRVRVLTPNQTTVVGTIFACSPEHAVKKAFDNLWYDSGHPKVPWWTDLFVEFREYATVTVISGPIRAVAKGRRIKVGQLPTYWQCNLCETRRSTHVDFCPNCGSAMKMYQAIDPNEPVDCDPEQYTLAGIDF